MVQISASEHLPVRRNRGVKQYLDYYKNNIVVHARQGINLKT